MSNTSRGRFSRRPVCDAVDCVARRWPGAIELPKQMIASNRTSETVNGIGRVFRRFMRRMVTQKTPYTTDFTSRGISVSAYKAIHHKLGYHRLYAEWCFNFGLVFVRSHLG